MISPILKKTVFISFLGHATAFGLFSFSFGSRLPKAEYGLVSFQGGVLTGNDLTPRIEIAGKKIKSNVTVPVGSAAEEKGKADHIVRSMANFKPPLALPQEYLKQAFIVERAALPVYKNPRESVVMFYPSLPYHFSLYFKDRQIAHIELQYSLDRTGRKNSVLIKRKITSGNLEADLLCMRYINHYLSTQQEALSEGDWHTVKIELQTKK